MLHFKDLSCMFDSSMFIFLNQYIDFNNYQYVVFIAIKDDQREIGCENRLAESRTPICSQGKVQGSILDTRI